MTKEFACTELQPLGGIDKGWVPQHGFGPIRLSVLLWIMPLSSPAHVFFSSNSVLFSFIIHMNCPGGACTALTRH